MKRLTTKEINTIKKLATTGKTTKQQIALRVGVNITTVYYHLNPAKRIKNTQKWYRKRLRS